MTHLKTLVRLTLAALFVATAAEAGETSDLAVRLHGMRNSDGQVICALFKGRKGFPDGKSALKGDTTKVAGGEATCRFTGLQPGVYAVAAFHDEDGDGEMDTLLGIPTEGFGFSNNARPGMFGPPDFKEAAFRVSGGRRAISIKMLYL